LVECYLELLMNGMSLKYMKYYKKLVIELTHDYSNLVHVDDEKQGG
jgi:hypothetical protein